VIVLDTHVLVWLDAGSPQLGSRAIQVIDQALADDALAVSAMSFWEIAMLVNKGHLSMDISLNRWRKELIDRGLLELPVDGATGIVAANFQGFHGDPADRIIVATTLSCGGSLITADKKILSWSGLSHKSDARR